MTVREVLERLNAVAQDLPLGLESPVIVMLCDGTDAEGSRELEVDTLTWVNLKTGQDRSHAVMIRGHPHFDKEEGRPVSFRGVAADADTALREWSGKDSDSDES
jgi:hypothetical protein